MNYQETVGWLFSQLPMYQRQGKAAYKADLENTIELDKYFGHPHKKFKSIHVAGTNGKGSVSHMLASVLQEAGFKVGLYTSPHLKDFRERIRVNGEMISEESVVSFVKSHKMKFEEVKPSFFEMTVAMAFDYFAKKEVDIAVIEVGMGGRLDSTNIIQPVLSVITNIGLDHTAFLGNTLGEIAAEKAGIIKTQTPVVVGETKEETRLVFKKKAAEMDAELYFANQYLTIDYGMLSIDNKQVYNVKWQDEIKYKDVELDLLGRYQEKNLKTALLAIVLLNKCGHNIEDKSIYAGLSKVVCNTGLKGRWQVLSYNPSIICDTAHNYEGLSMVIDQINQTAYKSLHMVFGVVDDKNIEKIMGILPKRANYYFTKANIPRALDEKKLRQIALDHGLIGESYGNVKHALNAAKKDSEPNDLIFIGGSTFVVAEVV